MLNTCSRCQSYILLTAYAFFLVACSSIAAVDRVCNYVRVLFVNMVQLRFDMVSHHFSFPYQSHIHIGQGYILAEDGSNHIQFRSFREPFSWCRVSFPNVSFISLDFSLWCVFCVSLQLLEKDPALAKYHSVKSQVQAIKRFGDVLVILVAAGTVSSAFIRDLPEHSKKVASLLTRHTPYGAREQYMVSNLIGFQEVSVVSGSQS